MLSLADANADNLKTITRQWDEFGRPRSVSFIMKSWMVLLTTPLRQGAHSFSRCSGGNEKKFIKNANRRLAKERRWDPAATHYNKEATAKPFGTDRLRTAKCFHDSIQFGGAWTHTLWVSERQASSALGKVTRETTSRRARCRCAETVGVNKPIGEQTESSNLPLDALQIISERVVWICETSRADSM